MQALDTAFVEIQPKILRYEKYRDALMKDPGAVENVARVERTGCLNEERSLVQSVPLTPRNLRGSARSNA